MGNRVSGELGKDDPQLPEMQDADAFTEQEET
jgi:hypothetical protein